MVNDNSKLIYLIYFMQVFSEIIKAVLKHSITRDEKSRMNMKTFEFQ